LRKQFLFRMELRWVDAAAAAVQLDRMPQMQHLVVDDVVDGIAGDCGVIEDAADHDGIVRRVVVPEQVTSSAVTPAHAGAGLHSSEETAVEVLEDGVQVVDSSLG